MTRADMISDSPGARTARPRKKHQAHDCTLIGGADGSSAKNASGTRLTADEPSATPVVQAFVHCRHYLPHIEYKKFQFITFRLYDSLPHELIKEWRAELQLTKPVQTRTTAVPSGGADGSSAEKRSSAETERYQLLLKRIERYEDAGYGQCFLNDDRVAGIVQDNLFHFNTLKYNLLNWCIMPNHVHVFVELLESDLSSILRSWRSYSAHAANQVLQRHGQFWMTEYYDRYIRDSQHFRDVMDYIDNNPVKAGFVSSPALWRWSAAAYFSRG